MLKCVRLQSQTRDSKQWSSLIWYYFTSIFSCHTGSLNLNWTTRLFNQTKPFVLTCWCRVETTSTWWNCSLNTLKDGTKLQIGIERERARRLRAQHALLSTNSNQIIRSLGYFICLSHTLNIMTLDKGVQNFLKKKEPYLRK